MQVRALTPTIKIFLRSEPQGTLSATALPSLQHRPWHLSAPSAPKCNLMLPGSRELAFLQCNPFISPLHLKDALAKRMPITSVAISI